MPDEDRLSIGFAGWLPMGNPIYDKGPLTPATDFSHIVLEGKPKLGRELIIGLPAGGHNTFRITYWDTRAAGNVTTAGDLDLWGVGFSAGDYLATYYRMRAGKVSYEYVTWPYPIASRHFRLKTLWQVQFANINSSFNAPLSLTDTSVGAGSKTVILPSLGLGITEYLSRYVHLDVNGSGFAIPHHGIADADGSINYRISRLEFQVGGRFFYFKTGTKGDFYMKGNLGGAFVGLKLFLN